MWGIQIGTVEGKIKEERMRLLEDAADNDTALTAEMTALDLDEEDSIAYDDDEALENRPTNNPANVLHGRDGTSTRALASEGKRAVQIGTAETASGREGDNEMPLTEVVKKRRRNECVPSSARFGKAVAINGRWCRGASALAAPTGGRTNAPAAPTGGKAGAAPWDMRPETHGVCMLPDRGVVANTPATATAPSTGGHAVAPPWDTRPETLGECRPHNRGVMSTTPPTSAPAAPPGGRSGATPWDVRP